MREPSSPGTEQVISLEAEDDFATIRRRLSGAQATKVILVVPPGCRGLNKRHHLRMLGRFLVDSPLWVALVAGGGLARLAREEGFPVFASLEKARGSRWPARSLPFKPFPERRPSLIKGGKTTWQRGEAVLFFGLLGGISLLVSLVLLMLFPGATVVVKPATYPLETSLTAKADPELEEIDFANLTLPAKVVEVEVAGREQMATTAKKDVPDGFAQGEVIFSNKRGEPTTVISGTIVTTSGGTMIRFRTLEEVTLPPAVGGRVRVKVEALDPGPSGNVPAWTINRVEGIAALQMNVINDSSTEGGTVKQVSYVTNEDKEEVRTVLMQRLRQEGYNALSSQMGDAYLPPESLSLIVLQESYDKFAGDEGDSLTLEMRALVKGVAVKREDMRDLALSTLQSRVSPGFQLLSEEIDYRPGGVISIEEGKMTFDLSVAGRMVMRVEEAEVKQGLAGRSPAEAVAYLERKLELVEKPWVEIMPSWWPRLPWTPFRISLLVLPQEG